MSNPFTKHPQSVNESYIQHLTFGLKNGGTLVFYGVLLLVHSILPFTFQNQTRDKIIKMGNFFSERIRSRQKN